MPANKKYLTKNPWQRLLKITAAIIGGYLVTNAFSLLLLYCFDKRNMLMTLKFLPYLIWIGLMVIAFLSENGWKIWGWYLLISVLLFSPYLVRMLA